jgi:hypothetical protein
MDIPATIGIAVGCTAIMNFLWRFFERATRQKDIGSLMTFKAQTEIKIKTIEQRIEEHNDSNSEKFNVIMSEMKEVRTEISSVSEKIGEVKGAFDIIVSWIKNGKKK